MVRFTAALDTTALANAKGSLRCRFTRGLGDVLLWLQAEPEATGKALMARLQSEHPHRFTRAQLRTMQRRVKEWRGISAKKPVYGYAGSVIPDRVGMPEPALIGADPKCQSFGNILW